MSPIRIVLETIAGICGFFLTFMMIYPIILGFFGFGKKKQDYAEHDPEARFLVLVPAHNEERVIGDIIRNLKEMDYPDELYDFYIIADNCTDGTAEKARSLGANVIETCKENADSPTGKPIALKKALIALGDYQNRYDLMMVFDADNLMDTNMFREVNSQYLDKGRPDFIQCYLGVLNNKGTVAWIDYVGFTLSNRFTGLAKYRTGVNCGIGGTGFAVSTSYLYERGGWTTRSLTEDFEMQVEATLEGRKVLWNHNTRVYDEKPTSLRAMTRQKVRWGQGHWYVTFHQTGNLFRAILNRKISFWEFLSVLTCMYNGAVYLILAIQLLCSGILFLTDPDPNRMLFVLPLPQVIYGALLFTYAYFFQFYYADCMDNNVRFSVKTLPKTIGAYFLNMYVCFVSQVFGLIRYRGQQHWAKTEHGAASRAVQEKRRTGQVQRKAA